MESHGKAVHTTLLFPRRQRTNQQDLFDKANICYDTRSKIIHGRWQPGTEINQPMADTEAMVRTVVRHLLERPGMIGAFVSPKRDDLLDAWVQSKAFTPPPFTP